MTTAMAKPKPFSFPIAEGASAEYDYVDPKNAHYNMAKLGDSYHPLDVFEKFEARTPRTGSYLFFPFYSSCLGMLAVALGQRNYGRPVVSQLWKYGIAIGVGSWFGDYVWKWNREASDYRDAVLRDYIEKHYEDFPRVGKFQVEGINNFFTLLTIYLSFCRTQEVQEHFA